MSTREVKAKVEGNSQFYEVMYRSGHWRWLREHGHCAIQNHLRTLENFQEFLETIQVHITNCGQLPSKEMSSSSDTAKGYSDLEIEASIVVRVM